MADEADDMRTIILACATLPAGAGIDGAGPARVQSGSLVPHGARGGHSAVQNMPKPQPPAPTRNAEQEAIRRRLLQR